MQSLFGGRIRSSLAAADPAKIEWKYQETEFSSVPKWLNYAGHNCVESCVLKSLCGKPQVG